MENSVFIVITTHEMIRIERKLNENGKFFHNCLVRFENDARKINVTTKL